MSSNGPETVFDRIRVSLPQDEATRDAVLAKRDEYAARIQTAVDEYTHPEHAALQGLLQGSTYCFDMLARIELIDQLSQGEAVDLETFADEFLERHPMLAGLGGDSPIAQAARGQVINEGLIVNAYCTGDTSMLVGGTGLQMPPDGN